MYYKHFMVKLFGFLKCRSQNVDNLTYCFYICASISFSWFTSVPKSFSIFWNESRQVGTILIHDFEGNTSRLSSICYNDSCRFVVHRFHYEDSFFLFLFHQEYFDGGRSSLVGPFSTSIYMFMSFLPLNQGIQHKTFIDLQVLNQQCFHKTNFIKLVYYSFSGRMDCFANILLRILTVGSVAQWIRILTSMFSHLNSYSL